MVLRSPGLGVGAMLRSQALDVRARDGGAEAESVLGVAVERTREALRNCQKSLEIESYGPSPYLLT
jgi:hypothetical protein